MSEEALPGEATRQAEILAAVESIAARTTTDEDEDSKFIRLSSGVVLEVFGTLSISRLMDVENQIELPPVPKVYIQDQGREIENPGDPEYQQKLKAATAKRGFAVLDSASALCTRAHSVPDGMFGPESSEWADMLTELNYHPKTQVGRYMLWVRLYAGPEPEDLERVMKRVTRSFGVREDDVLAALDGFQDSGERGKDQPGKTEG